MKTLLALLLLIPSLSWGTEDKKEARGYVDLSERERLQRLNHSYGGVVDPKIFELNKLNSDILAKKQTNDYSDRAVTDRFGYPIKNANGKIVINPSGKKWGLEHKKVLTYIHDGDYEKALTYLLPLVEQGITHANITLGYLYFKGYGFNQNDSKAEQYLKKAISKDKNSISFFERTRAHFYLAFIYGASPDESLIDYDKAFKSAQIASMAANEETQGMLGLFYDYGEGTKQDYILSDMWHNIAQANGDKYAAEEREKLLDFMTISELEIAAKLAQQCVNNYYRECK